VPEHVLERFDVRLVSVDRAGYGATDPLPGGRPGRVQDVLTVCDALGIADFALLAVSSGGSYALMLAVGDR
jgi:pimeloyl-ACP methyl ester carboxylesterase